MSTNQMLLRRGTYDEGLLLTFSSVAVGPSCPAVVPQFFTTWALHAQYATHAYALLLGFFVTVENKRLMNLTPKRKFAGEGGFVGPRP